MSLDIDLLGSFGVSSDTLADINALIDGVDIGDTNNVVEDQGRCPDCNIAMEITVSECICPQCGLIKEYVIDAHKSPDDLITGTTSRGRYYTVGDYSKTQLATIMAQLSGNAREFEGNAFPPNVLTAAAETYNKIQKHTVEEPSGGQKKFVKRGSIKDEILAALIYFEGIRVAGLPRKRRDITKFMKLSGGFARGENILRDLAAEGVIELPQIEDTIEGYIDRYIDALDIDDDRVREFVIESVNASETARICMTSLLSSKIAGALYTAIIGLKLPIPVADIEAAADGCKRNTFKKFYEAIKGNRKVFGDIVKKHGLSL